MKVKYKKADKNDLENIINFLSDPEIDNAFIKPLSQRDTDISTRVYTKNSSGHWLIAEYNNDLVGVLALIENKHDVEISTYAVDVNLRGKGIGTDLLKFAYKQARVLYENHSYITLDSWSGNPAISALMKKMGYKLIRQFDDPIKRPDGYQTVVYLKSLK